MIYVELQDGSILTTSNNGKSYFDGEHNVAASDLPSPVRRHLRSDNPRLTPDVIARLGTLPPAIHEPPGEPDDGSQGGFPLDDVPPSEAGWNDPNIHDGESDAKPSEIDEKPADPGPAGDPFGSG